MYCTHPKSLTTNRSTHHGYTCRSLDATLSPNALYMQLLLYYADVRGRSISDRVVRHDIQPWSSLSNPSLEGRESLLGCARERQCTPCFCRFIFGDLLICLIVLIRPALINPQKESPSIMKFFGASNRRRGKESELGTAPSYNGERRQSVPLDQLEKGRWERLWPSFACGAGLFSDGYLNSFVPIANSFIIFPTLIHCLK